MVDALRRGALGAATVAMAVVVAYGMATGAGHHPDRAHALAARLRCPVCQAESVADSPAETAQEMNQIIVQQVNDGRSDTQILSYFRQRYGDWILLDPPARGRTLWLWATPAVALVIGVGVVASRGGRGRGERRPALTDAERERVAVAVVAGRDMFDDDDDGDR